MSDVIGTYSFLPWLRLGVANSISATDGDTTVRLRPTIPVNLLVTGKTVDGKAELTASISRDVALYSAGDIRRIISNAIVKVDPRPGITNFEPNYMPYIEFYEEDFPWRYTPAAPDLAKHRLRPWLSLIVMKKEEFKDSAVMSSEALPCVEILGNLDTIFPPADQLWAWAHVHVNRDLIQQDGLFASTNMDATRSRFENLIRENPDLAYSRLLSPRKLEPNVNYYAFLMPTFESGRLGGLDLHPDLGNAEFYATLSAWAEYTNRPMPALYPYYHRWEFKTGTVGDFEYLVRLLKPRSPDARLGRRDMDTQQPGSNIPGIAIPELKGVLRLEGALKVPAEALNDAQEAAALAYEQWDQPYPHAFQDSLARFVNLTDDYARQGDPDPIISAPIYGRWHALTERLLYEPDDSDVPHNENWVHELNLDPRWRVPAGFGTAVVQKKQEEYMDAAWGQVGDIIEANRRIRRALMAKEASLIWHRKHLTPVLTLNEERSLALMAPMQRRVIANGLTVKATLARSTVPRAALSAPLRRVIRPQDHVAVKLGFDNPKGPEKLIERINSGAISAAPPRVTPEALPTVEDVAEELAPSGLPNEWLEWLRKRPWAKWLLLALLFLLALLIVASSVLLGLGAIIGAIALVRWIAAQEKQAGVAEAVTPKGSSSDVIDRLPDFPDFTLREPDAAAPEPLPGPGGDSPEAARFKVALKDTGRLLEVSAQLGRPVVRNPVDIAQLVNISHAAIDPQKTVPAFTLASLKIPAHLLALNGEVFREAMAYPQFDIPMYKPLLDLSAEHFLPNIDKIPPDTITLLETNQRFIESYMVGLNHEFARELLWREYPTDQRGSYFRQFWDPSGVLNREGLSKEALREKLRDIPPLDTWSIASTLGDHDHRELQGDKEEEIVLVIRGELLKRYPTAVIYAQKARWQRDANGQIDPSKERVFETSGPEQDWLRTPLYEAKVDPDITFIGFDLNAEEVQGGTGHANSTEPGWFFVIKERPGEPRFGLDIERKGPLNVWNDLAWPDVAEAADGGFLRIKEANPPLTLEDPIAPELQEKKQQYQDDKGFSWNADTNAAELAYILFQVPVLVGVHGREMLPS